MIEFLCPKCQSTLKVQVSDAGKTKKCPSCGTLLKAPSIPPSPRLVHGSHQPFEPDAPFASASNLLSTATNAPPVILPSIHQVTDAVRLDDEPEPWYFRYMTVGIYVNIIGGIAVFLAALFAVAIFFLVAIGQQSEFGLGIGVLGGFWLVYAFILLLGWIFTNCFFLLLLDMARSFRKLRTISNVLDEIQAKMKQ